MPAKSTKRATASRPRSTTTKSKQVTSNKVNVKRVFIIVSVISIIGAFFIFRASAATTNFEAENASKNNLVVAGSDSTASNGQFVEFAQPTTTTTNTTSTQRFPGDPNPLKTGKAYWGAAIQGNGDPARHETPTGKSLSVRRTYFAWDGRQKMIDTAKADLAANRIPFISTKTPGWAEMASGKRDAEIDDALRKLDALGGPVWFVVHHEPEGGCNDSCKGPKGEDDAAGAAGWLAMQKKIRERMNVVGTKNVAFVSNLMAWTFDSRSGRNPNDWWAEGVWDVYSADAYCDGSTCLDGQNTVPDTKSWKGYEAFATSKNIPMAVGEWGDRGESVAAGQDIQKTWDYAFTNKKDVVAWTYFDSNLNSDSGGWELKGAALTQFQTILKNDARIMRVNDLNKTSTTSSSSTSYGKITSTVTLPENGSYKLWARMKAGDATNNLAQVQIDSSVATNIGGSGINATSWTWASLPAVNLSAGGRVVNITGIQKGVKIDRVILTNETCVPTGTGDNCTLATPPPLEALKVSVTGVTNGQTVSGIVPVKVTADRAIAAVSFRPDNVWATTDDTSPYEFNWDTRSLSNGAHTLVLRTRADGDPGDVYTQTVLNVTVNNVTTITPPPAPVDSTKPSAPQSLRANLTFDWAKMKYVMNLSWSGSYDNVGVTSYNISRNGAKLGTSTRTSYVDSTNLSAGVSYTYSITATDAAKNVSDPASITLKTNCVFISCTATVQ